ncbi:hypothetical protein [Nostoc favosum]|uniref:Transposase n=1 Tax=Nostoc favosum CHAB5714 TaxID=2780399 RepID=A0ABS8IKA7_9NOSO|nr:hypothetical protein [Nostoc favosum]MCC5604632.1 hypothetical protein [Nostoc favosum CHAB5714]
MNQSQPYCIRPRKFEPVSILNRQKHNNPAELAARTMVQRRNISYATQTTEGTKAIDTFMSLVATTRKLGISFFEYVRDRISETGRIPSLASIIREKSFLNPFGWSWQPE